MTESVREKIIELLQNNFDSLTCGGLDSVADAILSLPSGLRAVRECNGRYSLPHPKNCFCHGTGLISRDIPISEAVEIPNMIIEGKAHVGNLVYGDTPPRRELRLPSGERVEAGG